MLYVSKRKDLAIDLNNVIGVNKIEEKIFDESKGTIVIHYALIIYLKGLTVPMTFVTKEKEYVDEIFEDILKKEIGGM